MSDNNRPKSLKDLLGENNDSPRSLEDVMRADEADRKADAEEAKRKAAPGKRGRTLAGVGAGALIVVCAALFNPWVGVVDYGDGSKTELKKAAISNEGNTNGKSDIPWYEQGKFDPAVKLNAPYLKEAGAQTAPGNDSDYETEARRMFEGQRYLNLAETGLMMEDRGFTSDIDKAVNKDGTLNLNFNYVTADLFLTQSGDIVNRLLNPAYGGWAYYQSPESNAAKNFNPSSLGPIFTDSYLKKTNKGDKSDYPVYADWKSNNFGMKGVITPRGPWWYGEVTDADVKFVYDKSNVNYEFHATYKIKYSAWDVNKKRITKNAVLTVKYVTDRSVALDNDSFRIKIDAAKLTIK